MEIGRLTWGPQGALHEGLSPRAWASLTKAVSAGTKRHGLETDSTSAAVSLDSVHVQCPSQGGPAQRLHGRQAPQGKARPRGQAAWPGEEGVWLQLGRGLVLTGKTKSGGEEKGQLADAPTTWVIAVWKDDGKVMVRC